MHGGQPFAGEDDIDSIAKRGPNNGSEVVETNACQNMTPALRAGAAISAATLAELAYGLHTADPLVNAAREHRHHWITTYGFAGTIASHASESSSSS